MTNKFNERVNVLTELLNEGHITNGEYLDLIESLRGGSVDENSNDVNADYEAEINNPNKLQDYEDFLSGSAFTEDELFDPNFNDVALDKRIGIHDHIDFLNPIHNTFYHELNTVNGLYKQDIYSGSILRGCKLRVNTAGKVECTEPFHSHEDNSSSVTKSEIDHIRQLLREGKLHLS